VLWIHGLTAVLLVQKRGEMTGLPEVTALLLHHIAMDKWNDGCVVITGYRKYGGSALRYCCIVTSQCYGYIDWQQ